MYCEVCIHGHITRKLGKLFYCEKCFHEMKKTKPTKEGKSTKSTKVYLTKGIPF